MWSVPLDIAQTSHAASTARRAVGESSAPTKTTSNILTPPVAAWHLKWFSTSARRIVGDFYECSGAFPQFHETRSGERRGGDRSSALETGLFEPLPVHATVIGVRAQDGADGAVSPGCSGEDLFELGVAQFGEELQRRASRRGRERHDLVEGVVVVGDLPLLGLGVHDGHDLVAGTGLTEVVVQDTDWIRSTSEVSFHHGVETPLDQRKVGEVVERGPAILGIVLARGERSRQLVVAQSFVFREQPIPTLVEFGLDFDTIHGAPFGVAYRRGRRSGSQQWAEVVAC